MCNREPDWSDRHEPLHFDVFHFKLNIGKTVEIVYLGSKGNIQIGTGKRGQKVPFTEPY